MIKITLTLTIISACFLLLTFSFPLILMLFVNKKIEKRYRCKLNIEIQNWKVIPLYHYYKYWNPSKTIAEATILNSQKHIDKNKCLKDINYKLASAPLIEKIVCSTLYLFCAFTALIAVISFILMKIYDVK